MIDESLQEQAALYAAGVMPATEREQFALIANSYDEVRVLVARLEEITALATAPAPTAQPSAALKSRILDLIKDRPQAQRPASQGFVITCSSGLVEWVNPEFSAMCGYSLEELRHKKLGPILQGEKTDRSVAERMRQAVHDRQSCQEKILNYHKNGTPYWVEIAITPIADETGQPRWFVAQERELTDLVAA